MAETAIQGRGRPETIGVDEAAKIVAALQRGLSVETACNDARVTDDAYYRKRKKDEDFRNRTDDARNFGAHLAGEQIMDVLQDITRGKKFTPDGKLLDPQKYSEVARINVARWWLEKKEAKEFGDKGKFAGANNTQNNYFFIDDGAIRKLSDDAGVTRVHTTELSSIIEASDVDGGNTERPTI